MTPTLPKINVNLSAPIRASEAAALDVAGVGLMRAEFLIYRTGRHPLFLLTDPPPRDLTTILADGMRTVAREFHPRPVLYRSMDLRSNEVRNLIGGAQFEEEEENPALGCRGINRSQRDADTFRAELEALEMVRQSGFENLNLMVPFVRWPSEVEWAREQLDDVFSKSSPPELWMMVETPATVLRAEEFSTLVDGVSIGSNDLTQLLLGLDRDNLAYARMDWDTDPAVLKGLELAVESFKSQGVPVGICGDGPSRSNELLDRLIEWGIDSISVSLERVEDLRSRLLVHQDGQGAVATPES
jgi:pyruvate,water dikinase